MTAPRHPAFERARAMGAAGRKAAGIVYSNTRSGYRFKHGKHGFNSPSGVDMVPIATLAAELGNIRVYSDPRTAKRLGYRTPHMFADKANGPKKLRAWAKKYARLSTRERAAFRQYYATSRLASDYNPMFRRLRLTTRINPPRGR